MAGVLLSSFVLFGCAATFIVRCPPLIEYTKNQLQIAAVEAKYLRAKFPQSQILNMLGDYSLLQKACRVVEQ